MTATAVLIGGQLRLFADFVHRGQLHTHLAAAATANADATDQVIVNGLGTTVGTTPVGSSESSPTNESSPTIEPEPGPDDSRRGSDSAAREVLGYQHGGCNVRK